VEVKVSAFSYMVDLLIRPAIGAALFMFMFSLGLLLSRITFLDRIDEALR
jgi:hypothetical protein